MTSTGRRPRRVADVAPPKGRAPAVSSDVAGLFHRSVDSEVFTGNGGSLAQGTVVHDGTDFSLLGAEQESCGLKRRRSSSSRPGASPATGPATAHPGRSGGSALVSAHAATAKMPVRTKAGLDQGVPMAGYDCSTRGAGTWACRRSRVKRAVWSRYSWGAGAGASDQAVRGGAGGFIDASSAREQRDEPSEVHVSPLSRVM